MFRRIRQRQTTLPVNYESTPLLSSILTPQCLFPSLLFTPALPLLPRHPNPLSSRKKIPKKNYLPHSRPTLLPSTSTRLSLLSHSSYYHFFRFSSSRTSSVTYLITLLLQSFAFVMGDNATEIDLDSVIDRLLEGAFLFLGSRNIIYGSGAVDSPYLPYSWWSSVHVGWHTHGRCPRYAERPPV